MPVKYAKAHEGHFPTSLGIDEPAVGWKAYKRRLDQKHFDRRRSQEVPLTASMPRRLFDELQAKFPEMDVVALLRQAGAPGGVAAHVISQSELDRTEDRRAKVIRSSPRRIGDRVHTDSLSVELASLMDEWTYLDGIVKQIRQKVFDGKVLRVLTD